jgi:hypothetical protein
MPAEDQDPPGVLSANLSRHFFRWWRLAWVPRDQPKCLSYGGGWIDGTTLKARLCLKDRWHTDSHAYDCVDNPIIEVTPNSFKAIIDFKPKETP